MEELDCPYDHDVIDAHVEALEKIVKEFVEEGPDCHSSGMWHECVFCYAGVPVKPEDHKEDCVWRKAKEYMDAQ